MCSPPPQRLLATCPPACPSRFQPNGGVVPCRTETWPQKSAKIAEIPLCSLRSFAAISPARSPEDLDRPILLVEDETADLAYLESAKSLRSAIERHGGQADLLTVHGRLADMDATGHAKVLTQIESFLNLDFYTYNVEIGKLKTKD